MTISATNADSRLADWQVNEVNLVVECFNRFLKFKRESMGAPGSRATCHLSDFAETWPV